MRISSIKELLPHCFETNIVPFLWGEHGIGKSEVVFQVGKETKRSVIDLRLGLMETGDLIGVPTGSDKHGRIVYSKPNWFPLGDAPTILFLDEMNRATIPVLQAVFQLVLNRRINNHVLPDNCAIVAAGNPSGNDYIVSEMDPALLNRFLHIKFMPNHDEFLNHATVNKFDMSVVSFLTKMPDMIGYEPCDIAIELKAKPRGWDMLNRLLGKLPPHLVLDVSKGLVGDKAALAYYESLKNMELPVHGADVLESYKKVREKVLKHANAGGKEKNARIDLLDVTCRELGLILQERSKSKSADINKTSNRPINSEESENFVQFLTDIPADLLFNFVKYYVTPDKDLAELVARNKGLKERLHACRPAKV
jgi:alkaline phosphatase D